MPYLELIETCYYQQIAILISIHIYKEFLKNSDYQVTIWFESTLVSGHFWFTRVDNFVGLFNQADVLVAINGYVYINILLIILPVFPFPVLQLAKWLNTAYSSPSHQNFFGSSFHFLFKQEISWNFYLNHYLTVYLQTNYKIFVRLKCNLLKAQQMAYISRCMLQTLQIGLLRTTNLEPLTYHIPVSLRYTYLTHFYYCITINQFQFSLKNIF